MQWQRIKFTMGPAQLKLPKFDLSVRFEERREKREECVGGVVVVVVSRVRASAGTEIYIILLDGW